MRLFVALALPWETQERLGRLARGLQGVRWLPPESYHLTLRFLGEMPPHRAEELDGALAALRGRRFELTLAGVGVFEKAGCAQALWAGVARCQALEHLQAKVETAVQRVGFEPERRRFTPHVTVARLDNAAPGKLAEWVQANNLLRSETMLIDHFTLFSSHLGRDGASYTAEVEYPLA